MRFTLTIIIILTATTFISWLNYRLLARLFHFYRKRMVVSGYTVFTLAAILIMGYGWPKRPPFVMPEHSTYHLLVYGALIWLIGQLFLLLFQPLIYVIHRILGQDKPPADAQTTLSAGSGLTRRAFLRNTLAVTPLVAFGISSEGVYEAQAQMTVQRHTLALPQLPPALNGFKIGQVSDTHLGPYFDLAKLDTVIQLLAREKPDLVVITGDFADDLSLLKPAINKFNDLQPAIPQGIYFCLGNHDYFHNIDLVRSEFNKSRIVLLENSNRLIIPGIQPFYLIGVDYPWAEELSHSGINVSVQKRQQHFAASSENIPAAAFKVLIAHHPDSLSDGFAARVPLTLAGHTHGGQVVIGGKPILAPYTYMRGLYRENGVYGYVSSGTGHWFPFRLGCPPEISVFTLQAGQSL